MRLAVAAVAALVATSSFSEAARPLVHLDAVTSSAPVMSSEEHALQLRGDYPFCNLCVQFAVQGLNILLNAALNDAVIGGCNDLCHYLPEKLEQEVCEGLCYAVGIGSFIEALEHSNLDFIYFCELADKSGVPVCPIADCPAETPKCAKPQGNLTANPPVGPQATVFEFDLTVNATAPTGTGMLRLEYVHLGSGVTGGSDQLYLGFQPGLNQVSLQLDSGSAGTDPSGQGPGPLEQGEYKVTLQVCEGSCPATGTHPHQADFGTVGTTFTIKGGLPPSPPEPMAPWGPGMELE